MKNLLYTLLACFAQYGLSAQYNPSDCGSSITNFDENINNNFSSSASFDFPKRLLACDDINNNKYNGFLFSAEYSVENYIGIKPLFQISNGSKTILTVQFNNRKVEVLRDVVYRPCLSWSGGICQTFGPIIKGKMSYTTWDDEFLENYSGNITFRLLDNGMIIQNNEHLIVGAKTDFSYEGLHLSGIDQQLNDYPNTNLNVFIFGGSSRKVDLTGIWFEAGHFAPISAVKITDDFTSPETNFTVEMAGRPIASEASDANDSDQAETSNDKKAALAENKELKLFPNPSKNGDFNVEFALKAFGSANFKIYNSSGQLMHQEDRTNLETGNHLIEFRDVNLNPGFYLIDVTTPEFSKTLKLLVE